MTIKSIIRNKIRHTKLYDYYSVAVVGSRDFGLILASILFRFYPIKRNKIVFSSFNGLSYNGQPFEISKKLGVDDNLNIVWILPRTKAKSCPYRSVAPNSVKAVFELMTAGVWIDNCRKKFWIKKKRNQLYIQTWHGPVCLKAVEKDAERTLPPFYVYGAKRDSKNADYIVSETKWRTDNIRNSFWYNGKLIKGEFKKDYNTNHANYNVRTFFGLDQDTKILLYAPTFREDNSVHNYLTDFDTVLSVLRNTTKCNWIAIIRMHPNVANRSDFIKYDDDKRNGTDYPSIDELILSSDYLITDYSGCIFEGYRAKRRVILYAKDYDEYVLNDREMYFDLKELPSPFSYDVDSLIEAIKSFDPYEYEKKRTAFVKKIGYYKPNATDLCVDLINQHIYKGKNDDYRVYDRSL